MVQSFLGTKEIVGSIPIMSSIMNKQIEKGNILICKLSWPEELGGGWEIRTKLFLIKRVYKKSSLQNDNLQKIEQNIVCDFVDLIDQTSFKESIIWNDEIIEII